MMGHPRAVKPMATYYTDMQSETEPKEHKPTSREKVIAWAFAAVVVVVELVAWAWGVKA